MREEGNPTSVHWTMSSPKGRLLQPVEPTSSYWKCKWPGVPREHAGSPSGAWDERFGRSQNPEQNAQGGGREKQLCFQTPLLGVRDMLLQHLKVAYWTFFLTTSCLNPTSDSEK